MPKGPQGQKRPTDTAANAIRVAKILTGEIEEDIGDSGKDKAAQALGGNRRKIYSLIRRALAGADRGGFPVAGERSLGGDGRLFLEMLRQPSLLEDVVR
jgi:hypothetical protein